MKQQPNMENVMDKDILKSFNNNAKDYFSANAKPIYALYIDIECFQDFYIGALLCLIKTEDEYKHILNNLKVYSDRRDMCVCKYFPELKLTDHDLISFINNKNNHSALERISPMTDYYKYFKTFTDTINDYNKYAKDSIIPQLFIGQTLINYSLTAKDNLVDKMKEHLHNWNIVITDNNIYDYGEEILVTIDHFTIYDVDKLFTNDKLGKYVKESSVLVRRSIHGFPFIVENVNDKDINEKQLLENTELLCNLFSDFKYVTMGVSYG